MSTTDGMALGPPAMTRNAKPQMFHCGINSGFFAPSMWTISDADGFENTILGDVLPGACDALSARTLCAACVVTMTTTLHAKTDETRLAIPFPQTGSFGCGAHPPRRFHRAALPHTSYRRRPANGKC